jgi:hypothetical protein
VFWAASFTIDYFFKEMNLGGSVLEFELG